MDKNYTVSKDLKTGLWFAYKKGFSYIPVAESFSEKKSDAMEYAKMYNGLPHKVEQIERKRMIQHLRDIKEG